MALIKTIAEIKANIPRLSNLSKDANLPNVDKTGRIRILPIIGKALYNTLNTAYNTDPLTLDDKQTALLKEIQLPLSAFVLLDDMPLMQSTITDNGIRTAETEKLKKAFRWEYIELRNGLIEYAHDGLELLLNFLYENKADYNEWTESEAYKELNACLIKTGSDFAKYYPLFQPLRTYWTLRPVLADVEENYMCTTFGRDLYEWIKTQQGITVTDGGEVDVLKLVKKALAHLTIKHAPEQLTVRFDSNGFTTMSAVGDKDDSSVSSRKDADLTELTMKVKAADRDGQNYMYKAAQYLVGIANGQFGNDWNEDFTTAFNKSPLFSANKKEDPGLGNDRRRIFVFR